MKILIIEDERNLSDSIVTYLSSEKYLCEQAFTYDDAKMKVNMYEYDCVLLDLMLPGGNGLDILRDIRKQRNPVGVIIVSAKDSLGDKVKGLEIGADDYLAKPFHLPNSVCASMPLSAARSLRQTIYWKAMVSGSLAEQVGCSE